MIDADVARWAEVLWVSDRSRMLGRLLYAFPEFRSVYYHRLQHGNPAGALLARAWPGWRGRALTGSTWRRRSSDRGCSSPTARARSSSAERIGANLQVHQGVTVGWDYRGDRRPIIGDDVFIGAGAKVLGAMTVGDGARIGANAVVRQRRAGRRHGRRRPGPHYLWCPGRTLRAGSLPRFPKLSE